MNLPVTYGSISVYVLYEIVSKALEKVGDDPENLIAEFSTPFYHSTAYAMIYVNEYGDAIPEELFLRKIVDGESRIIEDINYEGFPSESRDD